MEWRVCCHCIGRCPNGFVELSTNDRTILFLVDSTVSVKYDSYLEPTRKVVGYVRPFFWLLQILDSYTRQ